MFAFAAMASVSAGLVVLWCGKPAARGDFKRRGKANLFGNILELLGSASWAGLAFALLARAGSGAWTAPLLIGAAAALAGTLAVLGAAWIFRQKTG